MKLLLTGPPGIGKSTLVEHVVEALEPLRLAGFITREVREGGERVGFELVPFDGEVRKMAHRGFVSAERVGRYGVDVASIDYVVDVALAEHLGPDLWVVDEIGKMELFSKRFVSAMRRLIAGDEPMLATVASHGGLLRRFEQQPGVEVRHVTRDNRDAMVSEVVDWALQICASSSASASR